jgi:signal transduction histidine kinase
VDILLDINLNHASLVIYGDEQLLKIAILNLMDNGCKYSDNNQVSITLRNAGQNMLAIDFVNRGKGIDKEKLDKIFSPFYRANDDKTVKGFGIGLSLADRIVKLHAGTITVQSVPNQHTSFSITLPTTNESIL